MIVLSVWLKHPMNSMEPLFFTSFSLFSVTVEFGNLKFHFMLLFDIWFDNLILEVSIYKKVS